MAWRDSRSSRKRLLLAASAITLGIAALIAISAFEVNVREAVHNQAKSLLGADLVLSSRQPFTPETEALIASLGGEQAREIRCSSMAYFPKSHDTRLVQVRALEGNFPYYGTLETDPHNAAQTFVSGPNALVDDGLLLQFDAQVGDVLKLGAFTFRIAGRLKKIPGEAAAAALIGPRVYIPMAYLPQTARAAAGPPRNHAFGRYQGQKRTGPAQRRQRSNPRLGLARGVSCHLSKKPHRDRNGHCRYMARPSGWLIRHRHGFP